MYLGSYIWACGPGRVNKLCVLCVHLCAFTHMPLYANVRCAPMFALHSIYQFTVNHTPTHPLSPTPAHTTSPPPPLPLLPPPQLTSIVTVAYLSICAYFTVFKIRIFNFYYLAPRHCTDEYSLLFSAM